jgi:hypothetical protein
MCQFSQLGQMIPFFTNETWASLGNQISMGQANYVFVCVSVVEEEAQIIVLLEKGGMQLSNAGCGIMQE